MASIIRVKHRLSGGGGAGSPTTIDPSGSLSLNYDVGAKTPELWGSDGTAWKRLNPDVPAPTIGSPALPGGTAGAKTGIGAAWTAFGTKPTDPIVIASFAGSAYIKTGSGGSDSDWTSLGSATQFATSADIINGTDTGKAINSAMLRAASPNTSAGAADHDKFARLNANGQLDISFINTTATGGAPADNNKFILLDANGHVPATAIDAITAPTGGGAAVAGDSGKFVQLNAAGQIDGKLISISAVSFQGTVDLTKTPPTSWGTGDYGIAVANTASGSVDAGFGISVDVKKGDMVIKTAAGWEAIAQDVDLSTYVSKSGANAIANDMVMTWTAPTTLTTVIDGADASKSKIDNVQVDCGTF
jgi:hypothetical protein